MLHCEQNWNVVAKKNLSPEHVQPAPRHMVAIIVDGKNIVRETVVGSDETMLYKLL